MNTDDLTTAKLVAAWYRRADDEADTPTAMREHVYRHRAARLAKVTPPDMPVPVATAAQMLCVTGSRVSQMKRDGVLPRVGPDVPGAPVSLRAVFARLAGPPRAGGPRPASERDRIEVELTDRQKKILRLILDADSPVTGPEIAYALGVPTSHITRSLYRLEEFGYIERSGNLGSRGRAVLWRPNTAHNRADADIAAGRVTFYGSDAEFLASLEQEDNDDE